MATHSKTHKHEAMSTYIAKKIYDLSGKKNQRQIAAELGYDKPNIISMFKTGETKVPLAKIPALAKAIEGDAAYMFRLAIEITADEDLESAIREIFGNTVSRNEAKIIAFIRTITADADIELSPSLKGALSVALTPAASPTPPNPPSTQTAVESAAHATLQDLNFKVSPTFHRRFKLEAALTGISMKELLERSFDTFMEGENGPIR